jgi:Zn-dependent peptidase ImmA (M78 family)
MAEVPVNGKVLVWARSIRGLEVEDAAALLGVSAEELREYESGAKKPLVGFLRQISAKYRINFTSLLMPEPLPKYTPPVDHRARRGERSLSIDTFVAIEEVTEALEAFVDIAEGADKIIPTLSIGNAQLDEDPEVVAARERRRFGISVEEQQGWHGVGVARRQWRRRIEDRGVFTYMIPMPPEELSGFSILRDGLAAICVNDREPTEGAKVFTLFHEYGHLLLRQTGISDQNNNNKIERFCNDFAASFLMPRTSLIEVVGNVEAPYEFSDADIRRISTKFRVSNSAAALRLEKTAFAPKGFWARRMSPWDLPTEQVVKTESKPDYVRLRIKRVGRLHAVTVLRAVKRRAINSFDASDLIGLQPSSLGKVQAALG